MKLGANSNLFEDLSFEEALERLRGYGFEMITFGCGGLEHLPEDHCDAELLLQNPDELKKFRASIARNGFEISSIGCQANPVHPRREIAQRDDKDLRLSVLLAERLELDRINVFSGCPGDHPGALFPNWIAYPWPVDFAYALKWQWEEVLIPYWREFVKFSRAHGVTKLGFEFHPNWCVYNTETLLRLRNAVGEEIGVCLDPSHLFWMGMDPVTVIEKLGDCIFQVHGKDTLLLPDRIRENGVIETKPIGELDKRSWSFTVPGDGHDMLTWKAIVRALRRVGYDRDICFEHEDMYMGRDEGIKRGAEFLKRVIIEDKSDEMFWKAMVRKKKYPYLEGSEVSEAQLRG